MTTVESTAGTWTPNLRLASVMSELGLSNKGFARLMCQVSRQDGGAPVSPGGSSLARYKSGEHQPSARTLQVMVKVLEQITGRRFTTGDLGYSDEDLMLTAIVHSPHSLSGIFFPARLTFAGVCI
ncbi:helix-turn-helix domain-containing protein [Nocardia sp. NPDC059764]|uniref:helix-turn-helix domain-containing protein n=1 Tax=Nocardia sp. NPDC059764 TaxID=3346939 RepID=UPI00365E91B7